MAFTASQQAILDKARQRLSGATDEEENQQQDARAQRQQAAIEAAKARMGDRYSDLSSRTTKDDGSDFVAGFSGGIDSMQGTAYGLAGLAGDALERTIGVGEGLR